MSPGMSELAIGARASGVVGAGFFTLPLDLLEQNEAETARFQPKTSLSNALYGLLTEALGNLSLPCASRAAWPSAACATPSPVSVRRFSFSRTVLLLERFQPVRWRLAASDKRARPQS